MGIFRRSPEVRPSDGEARPLGFDDKQDLPRFEGLIDRFITSMGTAQWDEVLQEIALAGGIDVRRIERAFADHAGDITGRPWRWLLLGAEAANRAGKHDLVLKACGVVAIWQLVTAPKLTSGDFFEIGLTGCPRDVELGFYRLGLDRIVAISIADDVVLTTDWRGIRSTAGEIRAGMRQRVQELEL